VKASAKNNPTKLSGFKPIIAREKISSCLSITLPVIIDTVLSIAIPERMMRKKKGIAELKTVTLAE